MPYELVEKDDLVEATRTINREGLYLRRTKGGSEMVTIASGERLSAVTDEIGGSVPVRKTAPSGNDVMVWLLWDEWKPV